MRGARASSPAALSAPCFYTFTLTATLLRLHSRLHCPVYAETTCRRIYFLHAVNSLLREQPGKVTVTIKRHLMGKSVHSTLAGKKWILRMSFNFDSYICAAWWKKSKLFFTSIFLCCLITITYSTVRVGRLKTQNITPLMEVKMKMKCIHHNLLPMWTFVDPYMTFPDFLKAL